MKTIAQQLNIKEFPFIIKDKNNNEIYYKSSIGLWYKCQFDKNKNKTYAESSNGYWSKWEYDENNNQVYYETSNGKIIDRRTKKCTNKVVTIDGVNYELKEIKR